MKRDWKVVKIKVNWIHRIFANFARMSETPEEGEVGHTVFNKATRSLIHASHYCKMVMRVSHPILPSNVSPGDVLNEAKIQLDLEQNHREDDSLFMQLDNKNLRDHLFSTQISKWKEKLNGIRNSQDDSVRYFTCKDLVPPPVADDPATNYNSHDEELARRNRIVRVGQEGRAVKELENDKKQWWTPQAVLDNNTVFDKE